MEEWGKEAADYRDTVTSQLSSSPETDSPAELLAVHDGSGNSEREGETVDRREAVGSLRENSDSFPPRLQLHRAHPRPARHLGEAARGADAVPRRHPRTWQRQGPCPREAAPLGAWLGAPQRASSRRGLRRRRAQVPLTFPALSSDSRFRAAQRVTRGAAAVRALLTPRNDAYKRRQLVQLAIINGTYRCLGSWRTPPQIEERRPGAVSRVLRLEKTLPSTHP